MSICLSVPLSPVYPLKAETRGRRADAAAATQDWRSVFGARGSYFGRGLKDGWKSPSGVRGAEPIAGVRGRSPQMLTKHSKLYTRWKSILCVTRGAIAKTTRLLHYLRCFIRGGGITVKFSLRICVDLTSTAAGFGPAWTPLASAAPGATKGVTSVSSPVKNFTPRNSEEFFQICKNEFQIYKITISDIGQHYFGYPKYTFYFLDNQNS